MQITASGGLSQRASLLAETIAHAVLDQPPTLGDSDCEAMHAGFFTQPVNTVTSGAFLGVGMWLATRVASLDRPQRFSAATFAAVVALNGLGSVAYHGPQFAGSETLHDVPVYGLIAAGVGVPAWRWSRRREPLPGWSTGRGLALLAGAVTGGAAYLGGRTASRVCDPDSWFQFHGVWHLATAAVAGVWGTVLWPAPSHRSLDGHHRAGSGETSRPDYGRPGEQDDWRTSGPEDVPVTRGAEKS